MLIQVKPPGQSGIAPRRSLRRIIGPTVHSLSNKDPPRPRVSDPPVPRRGLTWGNDPNAQETRCDGRDSMRSGGVDSDSLVLCVGIAMRLIWLAFPIDESHCGTSKQSENRKRERELRGVISSHGCTTQCVGSRCHTTGHAHN